MPRKRVSLKGKGADIFYPNGEESDEDQVEPALPTKEAAPASDKKRTTRRKPRTRKPKTQPPADVSAAEVPPVKTPVVVTAPTPTPVTPVTKTPAPPLPSPPSRAVLPPPSAARPAPPPAAAPRPTPPAEPPTSAALTTSARYDRLAGEIDELYAIATRKMAAGRGVGQSMQWLSEARQWVLTGKTSDFAKAELLVRQVSGILKHGDEIDKLYAEVLEDVSDSPKLIKQCMDWLHEARQKIMTGELKDLIEAEFLMEEVKGILARVRKSRAASTSWQTRFLWLWLVGWLVVLLTFFIADKPLAETLYYNFSLAPMGSVPPSSLAQWMLPWLCLIWGAVGSVFDTLIAINEHMANRTYDGHYIAQGFASPIYGAILGILIYMLFAGGVVAVGTGITFSSLGPASAATDVESTALTAARSLALWAVAFLAGFFHNRTFDLLGKVFDQVLITLKILPEKKEEEKEPSPPAGPPAEPGVTPPAGPPVAEPTPLAGPPVIPPSVPPSPPPSPPPVTQPLPPEGSPLPLEGPPGPPEGPPGSPEGPPPGVMEIGDI